MAQELDISTRPANADEAFSDLYQAHWGQIHDFVYRTARNLQVAADVTQETFLRAWSRIQSGEPVDNWRAWLFAVARNGVIDELRLRRRVTTVDEGGESENSLFAQLPADPGSDPESQAVTREMAELVWTAAKALSPADYALLDLHVRRGFDAGELAESLSLRKGAVYTRLSRLKGSLELAVISAVMVRRGRKDCPDLDALLDSMPSGELPAKMNRAVQRHVKACERCEESSRRLVSPLQILAGMVPVAPTDQGEQIWAKLCSATQALDGVPPNLNGRSSKPRLRRELARFAATLLIVLALAVAAAQAVTRGNTGAAAPGGEVPGALDPAPPATPETSADVPASTGDESLSEDRGERSGARNQMPEAVNPAPGPSIAAAGEPDPPSSPQTSAETIKPEVTEKTVPIDSGEPVPDKIDAPVPADKPEEGTGPAPDIGEKPKE